MYERMFPSRVRHALGGGNLAMNFFCFGLGLGLSNFSVGGLKIAYLLPLGTMQQAQHDECEMYERTFAY